MPAKGQTFTPEHALTHLAGLSDSHRAKTMRAWCSDSANVIPLQKAGINKRLKLLKDGHLEKAFKPGRHNVVASSELKQWLGSHSEEATFGEAEMRQFLEAKHGQEVSSKTVKNYVAHAMYFREAVTKKANFKQAKFVLGADRQDEVRTGCLQARRTDGSVWQTASNAAAGSHPAAHP